MGVGLGFAIAAALWCQKYEPGKRVLCVEGDSAFGFSGMEVETMVRLVIIIKIHIFNFSCMLNSLKMLTSYFFSNMSL